MSENEEIKKIVENLTDDEKNLLKVVYENRIILENRENNKILKSLEKKGLIKEFNLSLSPDRDE